MNRSRRFTISMAVLIALLFAVSLVVGAVDIPVGKVVKILFGSADELAADSDIKPSWIFIVMQSRLPQSLTAILCGASLAVCGLMLQTAFHNPLAGPSVFGINSGASLGVALVMLFWGGAPSLRVSSDGLNLVKDIKNVPGKKGDYVSKINKLVVFPVISVSLIYHIL